MHAILRILVEAESQREAVERAEAVCVQYLCRESDRPEPGRPFDYAVPMERGGMVAGADRWTRYATRPVALPADEPEGVEELERAWELTYDWIESTLSAIQERVADRDVEAIANDRDLRSLMVVQDDRRPNPSYRVYDATVEGPGAEAVTTPERFEELLDADRSGQWVVPMDAHC